MSTNDPDETSGPTGASTPQPYAENQPELESTAFQSVTEDLGSRIDRYKLLQKIGEGGFGVVYMAEQEQPVRRRVALKIIKPGMDTRAVVARFEAERQALAIMDHPNIARVIDGGTTQSGHPYFVMELVKGVPITNFCDTNKLGIEKRLDLFITVCRAVQHAHQKGIIHRDLKPSNVLVTLHDGKPVPKVIDFGIAKAINQPLTEKTLFTAYGQMIGTPQYMSPEQAEVSKLDIDTRSDVYSLGVLLYELLTGSTPLEVEQIRAAGYADVQRMIREKEPPKPSTRLSNSGREKMTVIAKHRNASPAIMPRLVKGDLDWIVMKAIEKDRTRRYESASSFANDVKRFLNNELVEARAPSAGYRLLKTISRHRRELAAAMIPMVVVPVGSVLLLATSDSLRLHDQIRAKADHNAATVAQSVGPALWNADLMTIDTLLKSSMVNEQIVYLEVTDGTEILSECRQDDAPPTFQLKDFHASPDFAVADAEVKFDSKTIGEVSLAMSYGELREELWRSTSSVLAIVLMTNLATVATYLSVNRLFARRSHTYRS